MLEGPRVENLRLELGAVVDLHDARVTKVLRSTLESRDDLGPVEREVSLDDWAVATVDIDYGQHPKPSPIHEAIDHKVHAPTFVRTLRRRGNDPQVAGQLAASLGPHAQAEALLLAVQAPQTLAADTQASRFSMTKIRR